MNTERETPPLSELIEFIDSRPLLKRLLDDQQTVCIFPSEWAVIRTALGQTGEEAMNTNLVNGRIVGERSLHDSYKPELCKRDRGCAYRCVDCCGVEDNRDILECVTCGYQKSVRCTFADDFS